MSGKHGNVDKVTFIAGLGMLVAGLYWFLSSVTVTTGFYGLRIGGFSVSSGLVVVPFIVGVIMLFFNFRSVPAKLIASGGILLILASILMSTRFVFRPTSLYSYLLMLVFIAGGLGLLAKALLGGRPREDD